MKIKKFYEMLDNEYDYENIITILRKTYGWGTGIYGLIDQFETNDEYFKEPIDDNDYSEQFNIFLTDYIAGRLRGEMYRNHSLRLGKWRIGIPVATPTSIYNKLT